MANQRFTGNSYTSLFPMSSMTTCGDTAVISFRCVRVNTTYIQTRLIQEPSGRRASVVVADGDFAQPPQVRRLDGELVLRPPFEVVLVAVQPSFPFRPGTSDAHAGKKASVTVDDGKTELSTTKEPPPPQPPTCVAVLAKDIEENISIGSAPLHVGGEHAHDVFVHCKNQTQAFLFQGEMCFFFFAQICSGYISGRPWGSSCPAGL